MDNRTYITVENIQLAYGKRDILHIDYLEIFRGDCIRIFGSSGSGKSSFLSLLAGLLIPKQGKILYTNHDQHAITQEKKFYLYRQDYIGMTFSEPIFFEELSLRENLLFPQTFTQKNYDPIWYKRVLSVLDIASLESSRMLDLSSGERDRANIARVLLYPYRFYLLDEPGAHLDSSLFHAFLDLLGECRKNTQATFLIVSHDERFSVFCDRHWRCE